jgi:hypothetical protein
MPEDTGEALRTREREAREKVERQERKITELEAQLLTGREKSDKAKIKRMLGEASTMITKFSGEPGDMPFPRWIKEVLVVVNAQAQNEEYAARVLPMLLGGVARLEWDRLTDAEKTSWETCTTKLKAALARKDPEGEARAQLSHLQQEKTGSVAKLASDVEWLIREAIQTRQGLRRNSESS